LACEFGKKVLWYLVYQLPFTLCLKTKNSTVAATNIGKAIHIYSSGIEGLGDGIGLGGTFCAGLNGFAVRVGIEAVCAGLHNFNRSLSVLFWVRKLSQRLGYSESEDSILIYIGVAN
jgi:hypothetical protein